MARLTTKERKKIAKSDFALPGKRSGSAGKGSYPIEDKAHAKDALARVSRFGTPAEKAEVRQKVSEKFPGIGKGKNSGERGRAGGPEERGRERRR